MPSNTTDPETSETVLLDEEEDEPVALDPVAGDGEDATEDEPAAERPPRRKGTVAFVVAAVAAVVFLLLFVVVTAAFLRTRHERDTQAKDRDQITQTASRVATAMTSVKASGNQDTATVIHDLATGPLVTQYDQVEANLTNTLTALQVQSITGQVKNVYLQQPQTDGTQAEVLVEVDLVVVGSNPSVRGPHYLDVHLVKLDGTWKVDNVEDINLRLAQGVDGSTTGGSAPSSSAPAPTTAPGAPAPSSSGP